jgi:hypothetical protein
MTEGFRLPHGPIDLAPGITLVAASEVDERHHSLAAIHELSLAWAAAQAEGSKSIMPFWVVISTAPAAAMMIVTPWESPEEKRQTQEKMRRLMHRTRASRFSFLSEAWMASIAVDDPDRAKLETIAPRERSDRIDIISVMSVERGGASLQSQWVYDYDAKGARVIRGGLKDGLTHTPPSTTHGGVIGHLLDD